MEKGRGDMPDSASPIKTSIRPMAEETLLVIEYLQGIEVGGMASYRNLTKLLGTVVTSKSSCLQTAMKVVQNDQGILFENVPGKGYRRIETVEGSIKAG